VKRQAELDALDRSIKDGEIRLRTVKMNIEALTKDIDTLAEVEAQLEENIRILKKKRIVAMATEFKKAREDLAKTKTRLIALKNDRENFRKSASQVEQGMEQATDTIAIIKRMSENNVVTGKFGKKRNG